MFSIQTRGLSRSRGIIACAGVLAIGALGCHDLTNPMRELLSPTSTSTLLNPSGNVIVYPDMMRGWTLYDDQRGVACTDTTVCRLVAGPDSLGLGAGSAELATPLAADGKALVLADYKNTRFDSITDLRYATYRQSADAGNNLAIALQVNADYDLSDAATGYQGRLVFEPYQGHSGTVVQGSWQTWDAKAGKWWGTRTSVSKNGVTVPNPCVQATPCTWTQLLTAFPNVGIHATQGALILKAGSAWTGFRGNVDNLSIGVNGVVTTFDFEAVSAPRFRLQAAIGTGVVTTPISADSTYSVGSTVNYSFTARSGREAPIVVLDDTLAALSGQLVMDRDHVLEVVADTIYSYATLQPLEKSFADLTSQLVNSSDKVAAQQALIDFSLAELVNGRDPGALSRASDVADYVMIDPVRDSVALREIDDALFDHNFLIALNADGSYTTSNTVGAMAPPGGGGEDLSKIGTNGGGFRSMSRSGSRIANPGVALGMAAKPGKPLFDIRSVADPENPSEATRIVFSNGVITPLDGARNSGQLLAALVHTQRRFANGNTAVVLRYNRNLRAEMQDYDNAHPCVLQRLAGLAFLSNVGTLTRYASCRAIRFVKKANSWDFGEAFDLRAQLQFSLPPRNEDVEGIARLIQGYRANDFHVLLVGHSEGTLIQAQALHRLQVLEGHPLQAANRCVAAMAFAPAASKSNYGLDDRHITGFIARNDMIHAAFPTGWSDTPTPLSDEADAVFAASDVLTRAYLRALYGYRIHGVDSTYLMGPIGAVVPQRLATLHRECVMGTASLTMSASTVNVNSTVTASVNVLNQNANPLMGRKQVIGYDASLFQAVDSTTFRALTPRTGDIEFNVNVDNRLSLQESVRIPLVTVAQASYTETDYDGGWEVVFSSNGDQDSPPPTTAPTTRWDGSEGSCTARVRKPSTGTAFEEWQLRFCARSYAVAGVADSLVSGTHVTVVPIWRDATGAQVGAGCDEHHCIASLQVELYDDIGELVGRSSVVGVGGSAARVPIGATGIRPLAVPNGVLRRTPDAAHPAGGAKREARLPLSRERAR